MIPALARDIAEALDERAVLLRQGAQALDEIGLRMRTGGHVSPQLIATALLWAPADWLRCLVAEIEAPAFPPRRARPEAVP